MTPDVAYEPGPVGMSLRSYAEYAGVSTRTVKRWLAEGRLPTARKTAAGEWFIPADARPTEPAPRPRDDARTVVVALDDLAGVVAEPAGAPTPAPLPARVPRMYVTVAEYVALSGGMVSAELLRRDLKAGRIPDALKIGRRGTGGWLIPMSYVTATMGGTR